MLKTSFAASSDIPAGTQASYRQAEYRIYVYARKSRSGRDSITVCRRMRPHSGVRSVGRIPFSEMNSCKNRDSALPPPSPRDRSRRTRRLFPSRHGERDPPQRRTFRARIPPFLPPRSLASLRDATRTSESFRQAFSPETGIRHDAKFRQTKKRAGTMSDSFVRRSHAGLERQMRIRTGTRPDSQRRIQNAQAFTSMTWGAALPPSERGRGSSPPLPKRTLAGRETRRRCISMSTANS